MLLLKKYTKAQIAEHIPLFTGFGGILLAIGLLLPQFVDPGSGIDFLAGFCIGLSLVCNLFGILLLKWRPSNSNSHRNNYTLEQITVE